MFTKIINNKHFPFWLLAFGILIGLTVPTLIQDGMFMDAVLYTSVSHNLSMDIGNFWFPQFSIHNIANQSSFHEQPPLIFAIQSLFFRLFGDSMYVERLYTFITMIITVLLIIILWKNINKNNEECQRMSWLPIILWITIPVCFWSYSNNMQENTMGIFTLCSVILSYKAIHKNSNSIILLILSGLFIFLASFSKGIPGLFPTSLPILYWITTKKISFHKAIYQTIILTFIVILIYSIILLIPDGKESMYNYFIKRAMHRINSVPTVNNRFHILGTLFMELIPQIVLVIILIFIVKIKKINISLSHNIKIALFFFTIGLSGSIPIMLTLVQKGFYFVPSLPFFAIGFSLLILPIVFLFFQKINTVSVKYKVFVIISLIIFINALFFSYMQKGKISRHQVLINDVYIIGNSIPRNSIVSIPKEMWNNWDLQCYLIRYFNISLDPTENNKYYILDNNLVLNSNNKFKRLDIGTSQFHLYIKN